MKVCIIQPPYSRDISFSDEYFDYKLQMLDECDDKIDIIVLPEYSDVPCATENREVSLNVTVSRDMFLYRKVDRRAKPKSSGGSSSGSSGSNHGSRKF